MDITQWCGRYTKGIKYRVQWENREVYLMYPVKLDVEIREGFLQGDFSSLRVWTENT